MTLISFVPLNALWMGVAGQAGYGNSVCPVSLTVAADVVKGLK